MESVKTVIITGGGGHLGQSVARWWGKAGVHLVLIDRNADRLEKCRAGLASHGADSTVIAADVTIPSRLDAAVELLPEVAWSSPPSLVLAHGLSGKSAEGSAPRLGNLSQGTWQEVLDANLTSVVFAIQAFLPVMKKAGEAASCSSHRRRGCQLRRRPLSLTLFPRLPLLRFHACLRLTSPRRRC